jgi:hypothetical protein
VLPRGTALKALGQGAVACRFRTLRRHRGAGGDQRGVV